MFRKVESNFDKFHMKKRMLNKVQKFCQKMYSTVMNGELFQGFLEDLRQEIRMSLGDTLFKNKVF